MSELPKPPPRPKLHERKEFLPAVVLIFLVGLVTVFSQLSGRPPAVDTVSPNVGYPGEVMIITGRFFQDVRGSGEVRIGAVSPHTGDYLEWTDTTIKLRIPDDTPSDLVTVRTRDGRSNGVFFTNRSLIPRVISGPAGPGEPYVISISPEKAPQGALVTITGMNFGPDIRGGGVYFAWGPADAAGQEEPTDTLVPASEQDGDYEGWTELEIRVRVPDGATSGGVRVVAGRRRSNAVYFELEGGIGTKRYVDRRKYDLLYGVDVTNVAVGEGADPANALYVWVPAIASLPEQRSKELVRREPPEPLFEDYGGLAGYMFQGLATGDEQHIRLQYLFDRYAVATNLNPDRVDLQYDTARKLYVRYTQPDTYVPSNDEAVRTAARAVVGSTKNPYWKARLVYNYVLQRLAYEEGFEGDALAANKERQGDALGFSSLFVALCRAAGVPSRLVAGYLVEKGEQGYRVLRHVWAEFYLSRLGWVPVDPVLGEGVRLIDPATTVKPSEYYFGNLDNRHITFSKGETVVPQQTPRGRVLQRRRDGGLQTAHEEMVGSLTGYSARWLAVQPLGIY